MSRVFIANFAAALGSTAPTAPCNLRINYPSGRVSTAKGLGAKHGLAEFTLDGRIVSVPFLPERQRVITP